MITGRHDDYFWIEWNEASASLQNLLAKMPDIVMNQYLVNTSFDSGNLFLSAEERQKGWRSVGTLAHSPRITDVQMIPHDQFDEWLVFPQQREVSAWESVINYCGFSVVRKEFEWIQEKLWSQLELVRPQTYLGEGDNLILVTLSERLYGFAASIPQV